MCGSLGKMANGVDIGAHGNGVFCVLRLGAAPSLLSGFVALMMVLAPSLSAFVISHVSQPSADMKFGTVPESLFVFDGETESNGRFSGLMETFVVELGDFVHSHSEIFSVEGPCEFLVFSLLPSLGLVSGFSTVTPGMAFVTCFSWLLVEVWFMRAFVSAFLFVAKFSSSGGFWGDRNSGGRLFVDVPMPYGWRRWLWCGV